eukprot:jgi/Mesvir1/1842/Mv06944-RA.1
MASGQADYADADHDDLEDAKGAHDAAGDDGAGDGDEHGEHGHHGGAHPDLLLPLARIKRLMKSEGDIGMVSSEATVLIAKATGLFIEAIAERAYEQMDEHPEGRAALGYSHVAKAVVENTPLEFLRDIVPVKVRPNSQEMEDQGGSDDERGA